MARAQNAPKGLLYKAKVQAGQLQADSTVTLTGAVTAAGALTAGGALTASAAFVASSTATLSGGATLPNSILLSTNSTAPAITFTGTADLPGAVSGIAGFAVIDNSTGQALAVNTTGTTWKFLNVTADQPT